MKFEYFVGGEDDAIIRWRRKGGRNGYPRLERRTRL